MAVSGHHTHAQASVTSYNTADFTKISVTQQDIFSNQKSKSSVNESNRQEDTTSVTHAIQKLQSHANRLESGLRSAIQIIVRLGEQLNEV